MEESITQERLRGFIAASAVTQSSIAKSIGISSGVISSYLKGRYKGDVAGLEHRLDAYLDLQEERRSEETNKAEVVQTTAYQQIQGFLRMVQRRNRFGVVYGNAGAGKTTALRDYARANDGLVIFVEADHGYTARTLLAELSERLDMDSKGNLHDLLGRIVAKLDGSDRLIIIDEAEHLPYRGLELIRRVRDKAGVGIVLAGMPRLKRNLIGDAAHYAQLYSRISASLSINPLSDDDISKIISAHLGSHPFEDGFLEELAKASKRNARLLDNLIGWCEDLAAANRPYDTSMVDAAKAYGGMA